MFLSLPYLPFLFRKISPPPHQTNLTGMDMDMPPPPPHQYPGMDMGGGHDAVMHTTFFWGKNLVLLFDGWPDNHLGMYILALIFVFCVAVAVEALSSFNLKGAKRPVVGGLTHATLYVIRMALAYLLMLSVMSFNVGVLIATVAGHGVGSFLVKFRELKNRSEAAESELHPKP